jgi:phage baseplate assembly protein W
MATPKTTYLIDLPFDLSTRGKIASIPDNDVKAWKNKILSLLSTGTDERIWYHNYGANLNNLMFEDSYTATEDARIALNAVFASWLPELRLLEVNAGYDSTYGSVTISISYRLPSGVTDSVKINTVSLTRAGEVIEVI